MDQTTTMTMDKDWWKRQRPAMSAPARFVAPLPSPFKPHELYTPEEIAKVFKVERDTVYAWIAQRKFRISKQGRMYRALGSDLTAFFQAGFTCGE